MDGEVIERTMELDGDLQVVAEENERLEERLKQVLPRFRSVWRSMNLTDRLSTAAKGARSHSELSKRQV